MKELYLSPELEIIRLSAEDIVTESACDAECGGCAVDTGEVPIG